MLGVWGDVNGFTNGRDRSLWRHFVLDKCELKPLDIFEEMLGHVTVGLVATKVDILDEVFQFPGHRMSQNVIFA